MVEVAHFSDILLLEHPHMVEVLLCHDEVTEMLYGLSQSDTQVARI